MIATTITLVVGVLFAVWYLLTYNTLIGARNAVEQSWSNIDVELKRRFDLVENLVATVKGYAQHESQTFEKLAALRAQGTAASSAAQAAAVQKELAGALTQLVAIAEAYPQLRASENFLGLQTQLTETENRIAERRNAYNQCVNLYLNLCQTIPTSILAVIHLFPQKTFFDAPDELAENAPKVSIP